MRKKVRRSLALLLALTMMVTLVKSEELFVSAESSISEQASSDTEETVQEEAEVSLPEAVSEGEQAETAPEGEPAEGTAKAGGTAEEALPEETPSEETPSETAQAPADEAEGAKEEVPAEVPGTSAGENTADEGMTPAEEGTAPEAEVPVEEKQPDGETPSDTEISGEDQASAETEASEGELPTDETKVPAAEEKPSEETKEQTEDTKTEETELMEYIPEEQPDGISVKAYAEKGVLPENVQMSVTALTEESDQYSEAAEALENSKVEYDGFVAYDISFLDEDGKEIEPEDGSVQVKFELNADVLPEDADTETLAVQHLAETDDGVKVQTVADVKDETEGTVEVKTEDAVVAAEFEVKSFSVFTLTYSSRYPLNIQIVDENGTSIGSNTSTNITSTSAQNVSAIAPPVEGYTFSKAIVGSNYNAGTEITQIRRRNNTWQYSAGGTGWGSIGNSSVYFIYSTTGSSGSGSGSVKFKYYPLESFNQNESAPDTSTMKFTIICIPSDFTGSISDGSVKDMGVPSDVGAEIPDVISFDFAQVEITKDTFSEISIPGYTFTTLSTNTGETGNAYFFWGGDWLGDPHPVKYVQNFGRVSNNYSFYNSYLGFTRTDGDTGTDDYNRYANSVDDYYYAYNPTGTLMVVFKEISAENPPKVNFYNYGEEINYKIVDTTTAKAEWDSVSENYKYLPVKTSKQESDLTKPVEDGYEFTFIGWYAERDEEGNGTGEPFDFSQPITEDTTVYAKWEKIAVTGSITVSKTVTGALTNATVPDGTSFTFHVYQGSDTTGTPVKTIVLPKDGEWSSSIEGLQIGTYTIVETDTSIDNYILQNTTNTASADGKKATVDLKKTGVSVAYTNTYEKTTNDLIIEKSVTGIEPSEITDSEFFFEISNISDGEYSLLYSSEANKPSSDAVKVQAENGKATVTIKGAGTVTIKDVPLATYTVSESMPAVSPEGYYLNDSESTVSGTATVTSSQSGTVRITNHYSKNREIRVTKIVEGNAGDRSKKFEFTVTVNGKAPADSAEITNGVFKLGHGETITLTGLHIGDKVEIKEENYGSEGYITTVQEGTKSSEGKTWSVTNLQEELTELTFINNKEIQTPTGIFQETVPYVLMLIVSVFGILMFFVSRRRRV